MLTGDKYDLFRPVCNRPEKKKDRQEGVWGLGAEGLWGVVEGGSYCRRLAEALVEAVCTAVSPVLEQFHGLPTPPSLTRTLSFTYNLPPHISLISLSLSLSFLPSPLVFFDLSLSLSCLSTPSVLLPRRD